MPIAPHRTSEGLQYFAINRIPAGYTQYHTSRSDHIVNGTYRNGTQLKFSQSSKTATFQLLGNWFIIGGRSVWEGATMADELGAYINAPATIGLTETTGDFTKVNLGGAYNMIKPVAEGTGDWDLDLEATLNANVDMLGACPVPNKDYTGWFDYDHDNIVLTPNMNQLGKYDLFDFDIAFHYFCNGCFGRSGDGMETILESADIIGKMLLPNWQIKFELTSSAEDIALGVVMNVAVRKNV